MIREIIEAQEHTRFDRAHFKSFGDSALDFEVVYYVVIPDYGVYMDIQQTVNFELMRRFASANIGFAYPTQKLFLNRQPVNG
jgi:small-conductance mechanosensitive channel